MRLAAVSNKISESFELNWGYLMGQLASLAVAAAAFVLFAFAARAILIRGRGWEVPLWLLMCLIVPVLFPIFALIHFRKRPAPVEVPLGE